MHINRNKIDSQLTELEQRHLKQCQLCQDEQELLDELTHDVKNIDWIEAPNECWQMLQESIDEQKQNKNQHWFLGIGLAASFFLTGFIWLMWSNYQLQQKFEHVLTINQQLESQLTMGVTPNYRQASLLVEIREIEQQLDVTKHDKEKLRLLEQRQRLFNKLIKLQNGENDEIFI